MIFFERFFFLARYLDAEDKDNPALINSCSSFFTIDSLISGILLRSIPLRTTVISPIISLPFNEVLTLSKLLLYVLQIF